MSRATIPTARTCAESFRSMSAYHAEVSTNVLGAVQGAIDVRVGQVSAWTVDGLPAIRQEQSLPAPHGVQRLGRAKESISNLK
jgi:hypothetical protein